MPRRFGRERFGNPLGQTRNGLGWVGCGSKERHTAADFPADFTIGHVVFSESPAVPAKAFEPETPLMTFGDLVRRRQALSYGCQGCLGWPRQMSPHEAAARFGYDMRIAEVRGLIRARCKIERCTLELKPSPTRWEPYRMK